MELEDMGSRKNRQKNSRNRKSRPNNRGPHFSAGANRVSSPAIIKPVPVPLPNESDEDQALFSPEISARLAEDVRVQAEAVLRALEWVRQGEFVRANQELREIPRGSTYADWRMFVRGLTAFYENEFPRAIEAWSRLDPNRRASRIAAVLVVAANQAGTLALPESSESSSAGAPVFLAQANPGMIGLVRTLREQRPGLRHARQIAAVKHRDPEMKLSASQIAMLVELREKFSDDEPELVRQISEACIGLAFRQPEPELFALLTSRVPGPPHDPAWNLARSQYLEMFEGAEQVQAAAIRKYLDEDLPNASTAPEDLRRALAGLIWQKQGEEFLKNLGAFWDYDEDKVMNARKSFERSAEAWPLNRGAYEGLISCEEKPAAMRGRKQPKKSEQDAIDRKVARARERWVKAMPEDVEPRLWLIDHYLQNNNTARASELVESLSQVRLDNLRLKILPWKVCLFECLAITKKKRELDQAKKKLDRAAAIWPAWLSRDLIPFLYAAMELRAGDAEAFAQKRKAAIDETGLPTLVCDVMTLASLQMVNLPSAELKPFRAPVEKHVQQATLASTEDLARLGSFFWDLMLTGLSYPAWRMHGSKFGEDLCWRLSDESPPIDLPGLIESCLWMSAAQFYTSDSDNPGFPRWVLENRKNHPMLAAAVVRCFRPRRFSSGHIRRALPELELVEQQARIESSPARRLVLEETAATARGILDQLSNESQFGRDFSRSFQPSGLPGLFDDEDEGEWKDDDEAGGSATADEDDEDFDPYCSCPRCRAAQKRAHARKHDGDRFSPVDNEASFSMEETPSLEYAMILERLGEDGVNRLVQMMEEAKATGRDNYEGIMSFIESKGIGRDEFRAFTLGKTRPGKNRIEEPEMTPDEKREFRRKRKNPMDKKNKRR